METLERPVIFSRCLIMIKLCLEIFFCVRLFRAIEHLTVNHLRVISTGTCWYRQRITDSYPEGTAWQCRQFQVASLSVGPNNQVHYGTVKMFA